MNEETIALPESRLRFGFGKNWQRFLRHLDEDAVANATAELGKMLRTESLEGKTFLDIGCGSGLSSLAAIRLGARVVSFDYDPACVAAAKELRRTFKISEEDWRVQQGSALDPALMATIGKFDVVYSWGVLHHTGDMWSGLEQAMVPSKQTGRLCIALYNNQGWRSEYWTWVKRAYNAGPVRKVLVIAAHLPFYLAHLAAHQMMGRRRPRGMRWWTDILDWLGGYPFQTARPAEVVKFFQARGWAIECARLVGGKSGCNEFVFKRASSDDVVCEP